MDHLPGEDIELTIMSVSSPWGPLACIGHEGGVTPGDWWAAFWWSIEQRWDGFRVDPNESIQGGR